MHVLYIDDLNTGIPACLKCTFELHMKNESEDTDTHPSLHIGIHTYVQGTK